MSSAGEIAAEMERLLGELRTGELTLPIERYGLDKLEEAVDRLRSGEAVGRVVLELA